VQRLPAGLTGLAARGQRRYRCAAADCGWEGLLAAAARRPLAAPGAARRAAPRLALAPAPAPALMLAAAAAALLVPAVLVAMMGLGHWAEQQVQLAVPLGTSHDGRPLPAGHALQTWPQVLPGAPAADVPPLALREGCAWGQPGRNPYLGTTEQALLGARLPPEVVREITRMRQARQVTDRLEIRTGAIRVVSDGREFNPRSFVMTYGRTLCVDARVHFPPGHVEPADLYEARDARGRLHSVMVPDVCGNVSVLGARGERLGKQALASALVAQGGPAPWVGLVADAPQPAWLGSLRWALGLAADGTAGPGRASAQSLRAVNEVPEPGTLGCVLAALLALALQRRVWGRPQALSRPAPSCRPCASSSSSGRRPSSSSSSPASDRTG